MEQITESFRDGANLLLQKLQTWLMLGISALPNVFVAAIVFALFFTLARLVHTWSQRLFARTLHEDMDDGLVSLFSSTIKVAILAVGFFLALGILKLDKAVFSLLAGVGIVGLALGFAFQDLAANFVSGVYISFRRPFKVGHEIAIGDFTGTVKAITLRNIVIQSYEGIELLVPNKKMMEDVVQNYSQFARRRITVPVGVSYEDDLETVQSTLQEVVDTLPFALKEPKPGVDFEAFGDSAITVNARIWIDTQKTGFFAARSGLVMAIKKAFDTEGISIPFPIRTIDFDPKGARGLATALAEKGRLASG